MNKCNNEGDQVSIDGLVKERLPKEVIDTTNEIQFNVRVSYKGGRIRVQGEMNLPLKLLLCLGGALMALIKYIGDGNITKFMMN